MLQKNSISGKIIAFAAFSAKQNDERKLGGSHEE
jgi:hypothetical protein